MFDFHLHSRVSFDGEGEPLEMAQKAQELGLKQICFTDHIDYDPGPEPKDLAFTTAEYNDAYDGLVVPGIKILQGLEFGMLSDNRDLFRQDLKRRHFDFVIGSLHFVDGLDIYYPKFWKNKTAEATEISYFEQLLACVRIHDDYDVLGHITYISKQPHHPNHRPIAIGAYRELIDEILRIAAEKGKGIEVNTSGFDKCGAFLPTMDYLARFKELGGSIVTVGSDAHDVSRVGQYCNEACRQVAEMFGYVCTFEDRIPVFHKI